MAVFYNDIEKFCCDVLRMNIARGHLPEGTVSEQSIKKINARDLASYRHVHLFCGIGAFPLGLAWAGVDESIRLLTGGFPCQDISIAGQQAGISGEHSGLWKEMLRLIQENNECAAAAPFDYILIENVRNLLSGGDWQEETEESQTHEEQQVTLCATDPDELGNIPEEYVFKGWMGTVLADLASVGYDAEWCVLRASDVGAPHLRARVFILAYPNSDRRRLRQDQQERSRECEETPNTGHDGTQGVMAHTSGSRWQERCTAPISDRSGHIAWRTPAPGNVSDTTSRREWQHQTGGGKNRTQSLTEQSGAGVAQSRLCRIFNGLSGRMDRYQWPARPGEDQYDYEPSRVSIGNVPRRPARLKALGNAIVPQLVAEIGRCIVDYELWKEGMQ